MRGVYVEVRDVETFLGSPSSKEGCVFYSALSSGVAGGMTK